MKIIGLKKTIEKKFFIGIDLGWKEKKTTGVCILERRKQKLIFEENYCRGCKDVLGKNILKTISPYLKNTAVIAIDAPLTKGRGKGEMRLYEKFLSTKIFRQEKVTPIPPALMQKLCDFGREIRQKLEKRGFVLDINLIEVFPTLTKKFCEENLFSTIFEKNYRIECQTENQESALTCAILAYLHSNFKTRYLGYRDGFLFLPEMSFWEKDWRQRFYFAWMARDRLKYHYLITNVFIR